MAAFEYQAIDSDGRTRKGVVSADSQKAARRELRRQALVPLKLSPTRETTRKDKPARQKRRLKPGELVLLTRQLAMLVSSGTPVEQAVAAVGGSAGSATGQSVLASVRAGVVEGRSLSDAMRGEERSFPPLFRSVVAAGEEAGALGPVLERLAVHLEKSQAMRRKMIGALIYPAILAIVALAVILALLVFVVPRVVEQFDTMDQSLPPLTSVMIWVSGFLQSWGLFILAGLVIAIVAFRRIYALEAFRRRVDRWMLSFPVVGKVLRSVGAARFARTFATLAASGAPVLDSLRAARETTPNLVLRDGVDEVIVAVREGGSLSAAMARTGAFPPLVVHMAASGEASGDLATMFNKGADYLEDDFDSTTSMALGVLEPLITVVMGGLVMLIILAIMLPILQLNTGAAFQ
ncbi:MAG: type II secretion system inner membrane protein GspF [Alphaproteobacteria bacterium]|jgi:general secretion pathway protein F|nr:type II secretion system inner membrane protein GspF [Alphaproteobacteria bacterium]